MKRNLAFIILFFAFGAFPLYGLLFYPEREVTDNHTLAAAPVLESSGTVNASFLKDAGDYYTDRFAGRQELLTADALIKSDIFQESSVDIIVKGTKDHWLYCSTSVRDATGGNQADSREICHIVRTLELMQEYAQKNGMRFLFTVAPDKAGVYPQYIPYYCPAVSSVHTADMLTDALSETDVTYTDLYSLFQESDELLYHSGDSHWNNTGAAMVQNEILTSLGRTHTDFTQKEPVMRDDFEGDLDKTLYPLARHREQEADYSGYFTFRYNGMQDTSNYQVETENDNKEGTLTMFRDSFGNSLLPFMAEDFQKAYFYRSVPYRLDTAVANGSDICIMEIVVRNLYHMTLDAPVMQAPFRKTEEIPREEPEQSVSCEVSEFEKYQKLTGILNDGEADENPPVYIRFTGDNGISYTMEASPCYADASGNGNENGFTAYFYKNILKAGQYTIKVLTYKDGILTAAASDQEITIQ